MPLYGNKRVHLPKNTAPNDSRQETRPTVSSLFGQLVYLASLRDLNTGRYEHRGMANDLDEAEVDKTLRETHAAVFREWLALGLERQKADLLSYLSVLGGDRHAVLEAWLREAPYKMLTPSSAEQAECQLYLSDLRTLLELLKAEEETG